VVVGIFAWRQWRVAKDKLALDLFDRRWAASNAFQDAAVARMEEISETTSYDPLKWLSGDSPGIEKHQELAKRANDIHFLFGPDVRRAAKRIMINLAEQARLHEAMMKEADLAAPGFEVYWQSRTKLTELNRDFRHATEPYMMLGHISVNRPARRLAIVKWPFRRK